MKYRWLFFLALLFFPLVLAFFLSQARMREKRAAAQALLTSAPVPEQPPASEIAPPPAPAPVPEPAPAAPPPALAETPPPPAPAATDNAVKPRSAYASLVLLEATPPGETPEVPPAASSAETPASAAPAALDPAATVASAPAPEPPATEPATPEAITAEPAAATEENTPDAPATAATIVPTPERESIVLLEGSFTREASTIIYEPATKLLLRNDLLLSSTEGVLVSDEKQKLFVGDLQMETAKNTITASEAVLDTSTGKMTAKNVSVTFANEKNQLITLTGEKIVFTMPADKPPTPPPETPPTTPAPPASTPPPATPPAPSK